MAVANKRVRSEDDCGARSFKMPFGAIICMLFLGTCLSVPVDEPIRIDLPVYNEPQAYTNLPTEQPLKLENYPGGDPVNKNSATEANLATFKLQAISNLFGGSSNTQANSYHEGDIFSAPVSTRETAIQEVEGYGSKSLSVKENIQSAVAGLFQPEPIVDTIEESEKYGNTGDKFYSAGKALVGGASGISNFVNAIIEVPGKIFNSFTRSATEKLNNLGGKLIGL